jgi:hypothetical protein
VVIKVIAMTLARRTTFFLFSLPARAANFIATLKEHSE